MSPILMHKQHTFWKTRFGRYVKNFFLSVDQLGNTIAGGDPDETISSRLGKIKRYYGGTIPWKRRPLARLLDITLNKIEKNHCTKSIDPLEGCEAILDHPITCVSKECSLNSRPLVSIRGSLASPGCPIKPESASAAPTPRKTPLTHLCNGKECDCNGSAPDGSASENDFSPDSAASAVEIPEKEVN